MGYAPRERHGVNLDFVVILLVGVLLMILAVVFVALPQYFFSYALERTEPTDLSDAEQTKGTPYEPLTSEIKKGKQWFLAQEKEDLYITSRDGLRLHAYLLRQESPKGLLMLFHGYHSEAVQDFACVLPFYMSLGYDLLLCEQRSHGNSEGKYITFGDKESVDASLWVDEVVSRYGADMPIFLDGISMGATTVMLAGAMKLPGNVRGIIADCGFTSPVEEFRHVLKMQFGLPAFPLIPLVQVLAKRRCGFIFSSVNTIEAMRNLRYPILFVHGKDDHFVPTEMTVRNFEACKAEKTMILVDGAGHGGSYLADLPRCQRALKKFLEEHNPNHNSESEGEKR